MITFSYMDFVIECILIRGVQGCLLIGEIVVCKDCQTLKCKKLQIFEISGYSNGRNIEKSNSKDTLNKIHI